MDGQIEPGLSPQVSSRPSSPLHSIPHHTRNFRHFRPFFSTAFDSSPHMDIPISQFIRADSRRFISNSLGLRIPNRLITFAGIRFFSNLRILTNRRSSNSQHFDSSPIVDLQILSTSILLRSPFFEFSAFFSDSAPLHFATHGTSILASPILLLYFTAPSPRRPNATIRVDRLEDFFIFISTGDRIAPCDILCAENSGRSPSLPPHNHSQKYHCKIRREFF